MGLMTVLAREGCYESDPARLAALEAAGLDERTVEDVVGRFPEQGRARNVKDLCWLLDRADPPLPLSLVLAAAQAGCGPFDLRGSLHWAGPDHRTPQVAEVLIGLARSGRLAPIGMSGRPPGWPADPGLRDWAGAALVAGVLVKAGCPLTPDRVAFWSGWSSRPGRTAGQIRRWAAETPAGSGLGEWLDLAAPWADAGLAPAEAAFLVGLPADDPRRPSAPDLAVMGGLA